MFRAGEWFEDGTFSPYPTAADAACWDGKRWWWCPPEVMAHGGDVLDELRETCLSLIGRGIVPHDRAIEREERRRLSDANTE